MPVNKTRAPGLLAQPYLPHYHFSPPTHPTTSMPTLHLTCAQEGRKKGREFADEFFRVLPKALAAAGRSSDTKLRTSAKRLVDIWDERKVGHGLSSTDAARAQLQDHPFLAPLAHITGVG